MARAALPLLFAFLGCSNEQLQRMVSQPKALPYSSSELFEDGRSMRSPVAGTVPREMLATLGVRRVPVDAAVLARGRGRFDVFCATCHGLVGDGVSLVARNMALRPAPSLHARADQPPGYYFEVITLGRGLMPSYAAQLSVEDRWAVVAYVRALQLSQRARLQDAPPEVQQRLLEARR
jgi:mono/diheme cytochrome c family protein